MPPSTLSPEQIAFLERFVLAHTITGPMAATLASDPAAVVPGLQADADHPGLDALINRLAQSETAAGTLEARLSALCGDGGTAPDASAARDMQIKIAALRASMTSHQADLSQAASSELLEDLDFWSADLARRLAEETDRLEQWLALPPDRQAAFLLPDAGSAAAAAQGLPDASALPCPNPDVDGANYYWTVGPDGSPELGKVSDDLPDFRYDADAGQFVFEINRGWTTETHQDFNWFANNPLPDARYEYENGYAYSTDDQGRTTSVTATLQDDPWHRDAAVQLEAGHLGVRGLPRGRVERYDGGHLIPRELGGPPGSLNLVPMQSDLNRFGEWRKLETTWRDMVREGEDVQVQIEVEYYASGNAARRATPKRFLVQTQVPGQPAVVTILKNTSTGR